MIDAETVEHLRAWIGRSERATDTITTELARRFRATFDEPPGDPQPGETAPLAIHWCLAPAVARASELGPDSHPRRGGFLPPVPLPRRMWAGGALSFHAPLLVGDEVERISRIADVTVKEGRTQQLCFVAVEHVYSTARGPALTERHDIVYREADRGARPAERAGGAAEEVGTWREPVPTDTTLLFRYSALTFNGHRIHYDLDYARNEDGYPGLVVHGPLQATLLLRLAEKAFGRAPVRFEFRGLKPLIAGRFASAHAVAEGEGLSLWIADEEGARTTAASAA
jgi:3-methylfumaryl-CoA hydratase